MSELEQSFSQQEGQPPPGVGSKEVGHYLRVHCPDKCLNCKGLGPTHRE